MSKKLTLEQPRIKPEEITIDCEHSKTNAQMNVNTANQRGLLAYIVNAFDELDITIAAAKVHSTKTRVRDYFLIEKQNQMCDNVPKLISILTKGNN